VFAGSILAGAFLLFQVQPLICKLILPWFGGGSAVWTTCMLFFQSILFFGYAYAHWASRGPARRHCLVHVVLIVAALACLPIAPDPRWRPRPGSDPTWQILGLLLLCVGLPYGLLASTGPLVQSWFARAYPGRSPYRLYALSNFGSLAALISYPFFFEPRFNLGTQVGLWSSMFWAYAALCATCAVGVARAHRRVVAAPVSDAGESSPSWWRRASWVGLPACASVALLATTNHVCQDVAPMPFLWVAPLALYLLTFIICFDHERWYHRGAFCALAVLSIGTVSACEWFGETVIPVPFGMVGRLVLYFTAMFLMAMVCHGELVRGRPGPRLLTAFYLSIAAGGAIGGLFVGLAAPTLFTTYVEWPIALVLCYVVAAATLVVLARRGNERRLIAAAALIGLPLIVLAHLERETPLAVSRNFFGVVSVWDVDPDDPATHRFAMLVDGVTHGRQFADPNRRRLPVSYYGPDSGIGHAFAYLRGRGDGLRVGMVGLGIGTLAAYAEAGDTVRFYEINPAVRRMAETYFTYLSDCPAPVEIVMGDARISLEQEPDQQYDLLVLDAFSGHAIPAHLLTREAVQIYTRHLKPNGVLAFHVTNQFLDLSPVVQQLADNFGFRSVLVQSNDDFERLTIGSNWMLLSRDAGLSRSIPAEQLGPSPSARPDVPLWTDSHNDLFSIIKK
jgi:hypothetical protein